MKRLVLLGGGHAHVEVMRRFARRPATGVECVLVTPGPQHLYSGMVPGVIGGAYGEDDPILDLVALARAAGARVVLAPATRVDPATRTVTTPLGALQFDLCSCDVGSSAAGLAGTPGAAGHAHALRPIAGVTGLRAALARLAREAPTTVPACVVGGGAAGVEVALAIAAALRAAGHDPAVTLVERAPELLPHHSARARALVARALAVHAIGVCAGVEVASVTVGTVVLADGRALPSACTAWVAGAAAPPVIAESPLPHDGDGFLQVDRTLRAVDGAPVWGAGDCVAIAGMPWLPRAGVHAVRQGPVLAHNLRAAIEGGTPRAYRPRRAVLALLNTGDGRAILSWRGLAMEGAWVWRLKDAIDRRWVARYAPAPNGQRQQG
ncbi:MAG: FAD-dependent oxidoreductase [Gemmatirosa sp.]